MKEIWKNIEGYEGLYQVSNLGNVKSLKFGPRNHAKQWDEKLLKIGITNCGYCKVQLHKDGRSQMKYVHRLVAEAFLPNPQNKPQINHIDGDKTNNLLSNLEWCSPGENQSHAIAKGLRSLSPMVGKHGDKNPLSRSIIQCDLSGKPIRRWASISDAAEALGVNRSSISNCLNGRHKTSCGFKWEYE